MVVPLEGDPKVTDVVLVPSPYPNDQSSATRPIEYFHGSLRIADDIWLADFDHDFAREVMDACDPPGENLHATRQYGAPYGFARVCVLTVPQHELHFDHDARLITCVLLSRLVQPTSIGFQYAARIRTWRNGHRQIVPFRPHDINAYAFVNDVGQNWLNPQDADPVAEIFAAYNTHRPPQRILTALWHLETVFRNYYVDVRWSLLVTGLESLIHVAGERDTKNPARYAGSTRVFVQRLQLIGQQRPEFSVSEFDLREIYDRRSTLAHGQGFVQLDVRARQLITTT